MNWFFGLLIVFAGLFVLLVVRRRSCHSRAIWTLRRAFLAVEQLPDRVLPSVATGAVQYFILEPDVPHSGRVREPGIFSYTGDKDAIGSAGFSISDYAIAEFDSLRPLLPPHKGEIKSVAEVKTAISSYNANISNSSGLPENKAGQSLLRIIRVTSPASATSEKRQADDPAPQAKSLPTNQFGQSLVRILRATDEQTGTVRYLVYEPLGGFGQVAGIRAFKGDAQQLITSGYSINDVSEQELSSGKLGTVRTSKANIASLSELEAIMENYRVGAQNLLQQQQQEEEARTYNQTLTQLRAEFGIEPTPQQVQARMDKKPLPLFPPPLDITGMVNIGTAEAPLYVPVETPAPVLPQDDEQVFDALRRASQLTGIPVPDGLLGQKQAGQPQGYSPPALFPPETAIDSAIVDSVFSLLTPPLEQSLTFPDIDLGYTDPSDQSPFNLEALPPVRVGASCGPFSYDSTTGFTISAPFPSLILGVPSLLTIAQTGSLETDFALLIWGPLGIKLSASFGNAPLQVWAGAFLGTPNCHGFGEFLVWR